MSEDFTCDKCGEEFASERGLHIHIGQVHEEEVQNDDTSEEDSEEEPDSSVETSEEDGTLEVPMRAALLGVFVLGLAVGLSAGLLSAGSGFGMDGLNAENSDSPSNNPSESPSDGTDSGNTDSGPGGSETVDLSNLETEGEPVLGEEDAPVTMVVYEDYQCPYCQRFETGAMLQVKAEYVESGQVKVIWKDFPLPSLGHDWAEPSAAAMECVYRQNNDAFWNVKETIFQNQDTITKSNVEDKIISWASNEGVSEDAVRTCIENDNPMEEVNADKQEGTNFDTVVQTRRGPKDFIGGTPSSVIYAEGDEEGEPLVGAQPFSAVDSIIQSKLEN